VSSSGRIERSGSWLMHPALLCAAADGFCSCHNALLARRPSRQGRIASYPLRSAKNGHFVDPERHSIIRQRQWSRSAICASVAIRAGFLAASRIWVTLGLG